MPTDDLKNSLDGIFTLTFTPECEIKSVDLTDTIDVGLSSLRTTSTGTGLVYDDKWVISTGDPYTISTPSWYVSGWTRGTTEEEPEESTELVLKTRRKRIKLNFNL